MKPDGPLKPTLYDLGNGQGNILPLRRLLEDILPHNTIFNDFRVTHEFAQIGRCTTQLSARHILSEAGQTKLILLAIQGITGHKSQDPKGLGNLE